MAARKLQTEIDRTLKKVAEGVELFESIYEKMQATTNQTQKEKLELDLKTQIKKLQRLRDQIKTWVASNDIKDKSMLLENRRLIEMQMEKFKACEKEMKTKAFSKEGLIAAAKLDPKEQEKEEAMVWLQSQVEELQMQVEQTEAEIEALQPIGKKRRGGNSAMGRVEELEHLNERRKWHIGRLELVLRLMNNGSLSTDDANGLRDDVTYFVESNTEEDFDEDEGIYDELNLDEEESKFGVPAEDEDSDDSEDLSEDLPPRTPKKHDEESVSSSRRDESPVLRKASVTLQLGSRKQSVDATSTPVLTALTSASSSSLTTAKPPPPPNFAQQPMSSILKSGLTPSSTSTPAAAPPRTLPPIRYAAAAAAAVAPKEKDQEKDKEKEKEREKEREKEKEREREREKEKEREKEMEREEATPSSPSLSLSLTQLSVTSPMMSSIASVSAASPVISEAVAESSPHIRKASVASVMSPVRTVTSPGPMDPPHNVRSPLPQQLQTAPAPPSIPQFPPGVVPPTPQALQQPMPSSQPLSHTPSQSASQRPPSTRGTQGSGYIGSLSDLVASFESVKTKAAHRMGDMENLEKMLEGGYAGVPQPMDAEKPKYYTPPNPFPGTPSYYPLTPLPLLNTPAIFSQLDVETLFFVFYYHPGTYQQFLAARELKRQSWRFHVKYLTWFQRHSEPQAITEEYEQGVYVYFDWEGSWCQRKKSDFRFEYRYLSED